MVYWITWQIGTLAYYELDTSIGTMARKYIRGQGGIPEDASMTIYNLMDLEDGWNPPEILAGRMAMMLDDLGAGKRVLIMCAAGISRSNGLAMGVLSVFHKLAFDDARKFVEVFCPRANPMPDLLDAIKEAIKLLEGYS